MCLKSYPLCVHYYFEFFFKRELEEEKARLRQRIEQFEQDRVQAELELEEQRRQLAEDQDQGAIPPRFVDLLQLKCV